MFKGLMKDSALVYAGMKLAKKSKKEDIELGEILTDEAKARLSLRFANFFTNLELKALEKTRELEDKAEARKIRKNKVTQ
jgi:hypothetical protein